MKRMPLTFGLVVVVAAALPAQAPEPPLAETRLTVSTLLREDIFAGFLQRDLTRLSRAEKNIDLLLASRPAERASLIAWQASTVLTRAVLANEARQNDEFQKQYRRALDLYAEAKRLGPSELPVAAITGGSLVMLTDRLPAAERAARWQQAYDAYQQLWNMQSAAIEKLPLHLKGEVLTGLAQTMERTGRNSELGPQLERILTLLPDTPYAKRAQQWKDDPASRAKSSVACQTCHGPGTLVSRLAEISKQGK